MWIGVAVAEARSQHLQDGRGDTVARADALEPCPLSAEKAGCVRLEMDRLLEDGVGARLLRPDGARLAVLEVVLRRVLEVGDRVTQRLLLAVHRAAHLLEEAGVCLR